MLSLGMAFESSLNTLQAVSGSTASTMTEVSDAAKALGNDLSLPGASASDAALAMTELAKGGLSVKESMDAAKGTLQLAAAAQIDGAQAAQIQSAALNTFGLAASDAGRVADVLANAANASSGEITDFAQGMAQSGLAAKAMGISVEDTATTLALFANNGLSGSDAGTSFKTMLISLTNPSDKAATALQELGVKAFDAQGNFVGMRTVTEQLAAAQARMTTEQFNAAAATAFGTDALRAAVAVAESGTSGFDEMSAAIGRQGGAADLAAANSKGLQGAVDLVRNAAETASLTLYQSLSPALDTATRGIADMIPALADQLSPALSTVGLAFVDIVEAVLPLVPVLVTALAPALASVATAIASLAQDAAPLIATLGVQLGDVLGAAVPVLTGLVSAFGFLAGAVISLPTPLVVALGTAILTATLLKGPLASLWGTMQRGAAAATAAAAGTTGFARATAVASVGITRMGVALKTAFLSNPIGIALIGITTAISLFAGGEDDAADSVANLTGVVDEQTGAFTDNAKAVTSAALAKDGTLDKLKSLGIAEGDYVRALTGDVAMQDKIRASLEANVVALKASADGYDTSGAAVNDNMAEVKDAIAFQDQFTTRIASTTEQQRLGAEAAAAAAAAQKVSNDVITSAKPVQDAYVASLEAIATRTGDVATASSDAGPGIISVDDALQGVSDAAKAADQSIAFFNLRMQEFMGISPTAQQLTQLFNDAVRSTASAFEDASKATEGNTASLITAEGAIDTTTQAGSDLYSKLQDIKDAYDTTTTSAYDTAVANGDSAGALDKARVAADAARGKFLELAAQQNITGAQADMLADSLGLVAGIHIEDKDFSVQANNVGRTLEDLDAINNKKLQDKSFVVRAVAQTIGSVANVFSAIGGGYTGGNIAALTGRVPGYAGGGTNIFGAPAPTNPSADNLLAFDQRGRPLKIRSDEWLINGQVSKMLGPMVMAGINSGRYSKSFFDRAPGFAAGGPVRIPIGMQSSAQGFSTSRASASGATYNIAVHSASGRAVPGDIVRAIKETERTSV